MAERERLFEIEVRQLRNGIIALNNELNEAVKGKKQNLIDFARRHDILLYPRLTKGELQNILQNWLLEKHDEVEDYIENEKKEIQKAKEIDEELRRIAEEQRRIHVQLKVVNIQFAVFLEETLNTIRINNRPLTDQEKIEYSRNARSVAMESGTIGDILRLLETNGRIVRTDATNDAGYISVANPAISPYNTNNYRIHDYTFETYDDPIEKINLLSNYLKNLDYVKYVRASKTAYIRYPGQAEYTRVERRFQNANYQVDGLIDDSIGKPKGFCFPEFLFDKIKDKKKQYTKKNYTMADVVAAFDKLKIDIIKGPTRQEMLLLVKEIPCIGEFELMNSAVINQKAKHVKPVLIEKWGNGIKIQGVLHGEHIYSIKEIGIPEVDYSDFTIVEKIENIDELINHESRVIYSKNTLDRVFQDLVGAKKIIPKVLSHNHQSCEITEMVYKGKIFKYVKEIETSVKLFKVINTNLKYPIEFFGQSPHMLLMSALPKLGYKPDTFNPTLYEYILSDESHQYLPIGWVDGPKKGEILDIKRCHTAAWMLHSMPQINLRDNFQVYDGNEIVELDLYVLNFEKFNQTTIQKETFGLLNSKSNFYEGFIIQEALNYGYITKSNILFHMPIKERKIDIQNILNIVESANLTTKEEIRKGINREKDVFNHTIGLLKVSNIKQKTLSIYSDCRAELEELIPDYEGSTIEIVRLKYDDFVEVNKDIVFENEHEALANGDILLRLTQKKKAFETMTNYRLVHNLITKRACYILHREIRKYIVNPEKNIIGFHADSVMIKYNEDSYKTIVDNLKRRWTGNHGDLILTEKSEYYFNISLGQKNEKPNLFIKPKELPKQSALELLSQNVNRKYNVFKEGEKGIDFFLSNSCLFAAEAGKGKTHLNCQIIKSAIDKNKKVVILTPTHIAKLSLMILFLYQFGDEFLNSPNLRIMTIHSALGREQDEGTRKIKIDRDVELLIVDEVFNCQDGLISFLFDVIKSKLNNPTIILSGDPGQLPPFECESWEINADIIGRLVNWQRLEFTTYHRLDKNDPDSLKFYEEIMAVRNGAPITEAVYGNKQCEFSLCWRKETCDLINFVMMYRAKKALGYIGSLFYSNIKWFCGMPIISKENKKDYVNGQIFRIIEINDRKVKLFYKEMNKTIEIDTKWLELHFEPAYAITVHSCQGLNIKEGEITLFEMAGNYGLKRPKEIAYTAITRVSKLSQLNLGNEKELLKEAKEAGFVNLKKIKTNPHNHSFEF